MERKKLQAICKYKLGVLSKFKKRKEPGINCKCKLGVTNKVKIGKNLVQILNIY